MPSAQPPGDPPAGTITLREWAARHGRTFSLVRQFWRHREGFPGPCGELPPRGRHGGGRGELLYDEAALDRWLASQPDLAQPRRIAPADLRIDPEERITLGRFAAVIGKARNTVAQYQDQPGFPGPDAEGRYRAGDLIRFWNSRPGRRGPSRRRGTPA